MTKTISLGRILVVMSTEESLPAAEGDISNALSGRIGRDSPVPVGPTSSLGMTNDSPHTAQGLTHAGVIDLFAVDQARNEVLLVMNEFRPWNGGDEQLHQLQEKFNAYASFILDGEMTEAHPELVGKSTRIELRCLEMPSEGALTLIGAIHDQLALQDIRVEVVVREEVCGEDCTCHHPGSQSKNPEIGRASCRERV